MILFEKERYPCHKVCGEYVSRESVPFLRSLGVDLDDAAFPQIRKLQVSAPGGKMLEENLGLGGVGVSRFHLDHLLATLARAAGVELREGSKVQDVRFLRDGHEVRTDQETIMANVVAGSYGKRSNLDIKFGRSFVDAKPSKLNNYIGIKYHVKSSFPKDTIALHNFSDGYCGISAIEDDKHCLCYLTTAANLTRCGNSIEMMEARILSENPHLERILKEAEKLYEQPLAISQISFERKSLVHEHVLMVGDSAGMITPLCGNGMSMAMHGSKLAFRQISSYLGGSISRHEMERDYSSSWERAFSSRLRSGRLIQSMFGDKTLTNLLISGVKPFPGLVRGLIRQTHGNTF